MTAEIPPAPGGMARVIARPRKRAARIASAKPIAPPQTSAAYSPKLCPASASGRKSDPDSDSEFDSESDFDSDSDSKARKTPTSIASIAGWVFSVNCKSASGDDGENDSAIAFRSAETISDASASASPTRGCAAYFCAMPGNCEPCPGKTIANFFIVRLPDSSGPSPRPR